MGYSFKRKEQKKRILLKKIMMHGVLE